MAGDVTVLRRPFQRGTDDSRALLRQAARLYTGLDGPWEMAQTPEGKPFFPALPQLGCSVSHSGIFWMCALDGQPLGLDLQRHSTFSPPEKLARRFFHPDEVNWLAQGGFQRFFDVWAAKESFLKFTGQGLRGGLKGFSTVSTDGEFPAVPGAQLRLLPCPEGYSLCLCGREIGAVEQKEF